MQLIGTYSSFYEKMIKDYVLEQSKSFHLLEMVDLVLFIFLNTLNTTLFVLYGGYHARLSAIADNNPNL